MKFIFRRELGEEHWFVLLQTARGAVVAVYEWSATLFFLVAEVLGIYLADTKVPVEVLIPVGILGLFMWFNHRCCLQPWRRPN
jgi:hypothetical protein